MLKNQRGLPAAAGELHAERGVNGPALRTPHSALRICFPVWWRHVLVALATLILCSCQSPAVNLSVDGYVTPVADRAQAVERIQASKDQTNLPKALPKSSIRLVSPSAEISPEASAVDSLPAEMCEGAPPVDPSIELASLGACPCCSGGACGPSCGYDPGPLVGPSDEYLCDGGDFGLPAGVRADWTVNGLEQEDTVAHYDTVDGRVVVVPTNRVCLYAPRFAAVRQVVSVVAHERRQLVEVVDEELSLIEADETMPVATTLQRNSAAINLRDQPPSSFRARQQAGATENLQAVIEAFGGLAAYCDFTVVRTGEVSGAEKPLVERSVQAAITWTGDQAVQVVFDSRQAVANVQVQEAGIVYRLDEPESPQLRIIKLASTGHALPGEEVEFTLRFDNTGDQTIGNVTIVDNLATRLEFVEKSNASTLDANFTTVPNGAGSDVLRWEIVEPLKPDQGGLLRFRAKVR